MSAQRMSRRNRGNLAGSARCHGGDHPLRSRCHGEEWSVQNSPRPLYPNLSCFSNVSLIYTGRRDWPNLTSVLVGDIAGRLLRSDVAEYIRLRAACKEWRNCTADPREREGDILFRPCRWIMLSNRTDGDTRRFLNLSTGAALASTSGSSTSTTSRPAPRDSCSCATSRPTPRGSSTRSPGPSSTSRPSPRTSAARTPSGRDRSRARRASSTPASPTRPPRRRSCS